MTTEKKSALVDNSFFQPIFSHPSESDRRRFLEELTNRYRLVIPFILIEEVFIGLARPKSPERARVLLMIARFLAGNSSCWIDDEIEIVFKELVLRAPV